MGNTTELHTGLEVNHYLYKYVHCLIVHNVQVHAITNTNYCYNTHTQYTVLPKWETCSTSETTILFKLCHESLLLFGPSLHFTSLHLTQSNQFLCIKSSLTQHFFI